MMTDGEEERKREKKIAVRMAKERCSSSTGVKRALSLREKKCECPYLVDDEFGALSVLLRDLLGLDRGGKLVAKREVGDGHVLDLDEEVRGALDERLADLRRDGLALRDELGRVEL
jgi:hypothetical protein